MLVAAGQKAAAGSVYFTWKLCLLTILMFFPGANSATERLLSTAGDMTLITAQRITLPALI